MIISKLFTNINLLQIQSWQGIAIWCHMTYIFCMCHMSCCMSCHMWGMANILSYFVCLSITYAILRCIQSFSFVLVYKVGLLIRLLHCCYFAIHGTHLGFKVSSFRFRDFAYLLSTMSCMI